MRSALCTSLAVEDIMRSALCTSLSVEDIMRSALCTSLKYVCDWVLSGEWGHCFAHHACVIFASFSAACILFGHAMHVRVRVRKCACALEICMCCIH